MYPWLVMGMENRRSFLTIRGNILQNSLSVDTLINSKMFVRAPNKLVVCQMR